MPRLENLERFKEILYSLGSEPQVTAARAETREDDLPETDAAGAEPLAADTGGEGAGPSAADLDDLLGGIPEGSSATLAADAAPAETEPEEASGFDTEPAEAEASEGLDFGDLFGESPPAGEESAEAPEVEAGIPESLFDTPEPGVAEPSEPAPAEDFGAFDFDEPGTEAVPTEDFTLPEPAGVGVEAAADARSEPTEPFGDLSAGLGDLDALSPPGTETGEEGAAFDLQGLDAGPTEEAPEDAGGQAESIEDLAEGFSLEDLAGELGETPPIVSAAAPEGPGVEPEGTPPAEGPEEITLDDREFRAIQRNLQTLPRNLKIAIETLLGEQGYDGEGLRPLLDLLVRGASPHDVAAQVGRITGATIRIPARFERQTGIAFEEEARTLGYIFRTSVLPMLRTIILVGGLLAVLSYGAYRYVYLPLYAQSLYRTGLRSLDREQYGDAERTFDRAASVRAVKRWYYRYADGFIRKKQYNLADRKYEQIEQRFGYDKKELLDRAALQSGKLGSYETAEGLLSRVLDRDIFDREGGLALGDNYLEWARYTPAEEGEERTRESLLEDARQAYARLLQRYGYRTDILLRMMRYFVRADLLGDVQDLRAYLEADPRFKPDPAVYAEVGGYLLDKGAVEDSRTTLLKAEAVGTVLPEIDYNLARLYDAIDEPAEEGRALRNTLLGLSNAERTPERVYIEVDARRRLGDWLYREERYLDATEEYTRAIDLTEDAQDGGVLGRRAELGLAYAGLGNIRYYVDGEYVRALDLYRRARQNGLEDTEMDYRVGYIHYALGDYATAVQEMVPLQERLPQNWNVLFAAGTALLQREDYFAAEGYYRRLIARLQDRRDAIRSLQPVVNPDHFMLVNLLLKAHNNLGVAYYRQGQARGGRGPEYTRALVQITEAAQYLDVLARDPETLERSEARNLAYLNANAIQHPGEGFEPAIYDRIPKDTVADRF